MKEIEKYNKQVKIAAIIGCVIGVILALLIVVTVHAGMDFTGMRGSSPIDNIPHKGLGKPRDNGYIVINGIELRTSPGYGIETLTNPEEVRNADELERRFMSEIIRLRVAVLKSTKDPRYEAVNALYQATGFVGVKGRPSSEYNENSLRAQISRSRRMIKDGIGDKEEHLNKIRRINKILREHGVDAKLRGDEVSSPYTPDFPGRLRW